MWCSDNLRDKQILEKNKVCYAIINGKDKEVIKDKKLFTYTLYLETFGFIYITKANNKEHTYKIGEECEVEVCTYICSCIAKPS